MTFSSNPVEFMNDYKPIINLQSQSCITKKRNRENFFFTSDVASLILVPWKLNHERAAGGWEPCE